MKYLPEIESSLKKTHSFVGKHMAWFLNGLKHCLNSPPPPVVWRTRGREILSGPWLDARESWAQPALSLPPQQAPPPYALTGGWHCQWEVPGKGVVTERGGDWNGLKLAYKLIKLPFVFTHETHCLMTERVLFPVQLYIFWNQTWDVCEYTVCRTKILCQTEDCV